MPQFISQLNQAQLILNATLIESNRGNNSSVVRVEMFLNCGNRASFTGNPVSYSINIAGVVKSGTFTFDFRRTGSVLVGVHEVRVGHRADGTQSLSTTGSVGPNGTSAVGSGGTGGDWNLPSLPPIQPTNLRLLGGSDTSLRIGWNGPTTGSTPARTIVQLSTDSGYVNLAQHESVTQEDTWTGLSPSRTYWFRVLSQNASGNSEWTTGAFTTSIGVPGAPSDNYASKITPTSAQFDWNAPSYNGGQAPTQYQFQYATASDFSNAVTLATPNATPSIVVTGLAPGNRYAVRVRARNSAGWGPWSASGGITTLPSTAPTLNATPAVSGKSAIVNAYPPSGVTGVDYWILSIYDVAGNSTRTQQNVNATQTVTNLIPGREYRYSVRAVIGTYTSPVSATVSATQPAPSVNAGGYFDGAKAASGDQTYGWLGTAEASNSVAYGVNVTGWQLGVFNGRGVLTRATGGVDDKYYAQATFQSDMLDRPGGWQLGQDVGASVLTSGMAAKIEADAPYNFSIHVNVARDLMLVVFAQFYTETGTTAGSGYGTPRLVKAADDWVRIDATIRTPQNAAYARLLIQDASGDGVRERYTWPNGLVGLERPQTYIDGVLTRTNALRNGLPMSDQGAVSLVVDPNTSEPSGVIRDTSYLMYSGVLAKVGARLSQLDRLPITPDMTQIYARLKLRYADGGIGAQQPGERRTTAKIVFLDSSGKEISWVQPLGQTLGEKYRWLGAPFRSASQQLKAGVDRVQLYVDPTFNDPNSTGSSGSGGGTATSAVERYLTPAGPPETGASVWSLLKRWTGTGTAIGLNNGGIGTFATPVPVTPGKPYTFSAWVKVNATGRRCNIVLTYFDKNGTGFTGAKPTSVSVLMPAGQWMPISYTVLAPQAAATVRVSFEFIGSGVWGPGDTIEFNSPIYEEAYGRNSFFHGGMVSATDGLVTDQVTRDLTVFGDDTEFVMQASIPEGAVNADLWVSRDPHSTAKVADLLSMKEIVLSQGPGQFFDGNTGFRRSLAGDTLGIDAAMIMLNGIIPYFDGSTADTVENRYDWLGTANASASSKTALDTTKVNLLADPDIPAIPVAPRPPVLVDAGIVTVGTWRRYWVSIPASEVNDFIDQVPTVLLTTGAVSARQVRIRLFSNPDALLPSEIDDKNYDSEQIVSFIPAKTSMMIDGVAERVWASVNGADSATADHLLYGTGGVPATWPVLSCGQGYLLAFDVPLDSPANNLTIDVSLTRRV
jgi:hypothetical protein